MVFNNATEGDWVKSQISVLFKSLEHILPKLVISGTFRGKSKCSDSGQSRLKFSKEVKSICHPQAMSEYILHNYTMFISNSCYEFNLAL